MAFQASWIQQQLGSELLALRETKGLTTRQVGDALGWAHTKVGRIERAENKIDPIDVIRLARLYGVLDAETERLCEMARGSRTDTWWEKYKPWLAESYYTVIGYENDATRLDCLHSAVIHGLLQTREYAVALMKTGSLVRDPDRLEANVEVRMLRQRRFSEPEPLILDAIIAEHVLHVPHGGVDVLNRQLRHLREMADHPAATIRITPLASPVVQMPIDIYSFGGPDGPAIAAAETLSETVVYDSPIDVRQARRALAHVCSYAFDPADSIKFLEQRIHETAQ